MISGENKSVLRKELKLQSLLVDEITDAEIVVRQVRVRKLQIHQRDKAIRTAFE